MRFAIDSVRSVIFAACGVVAWASGERALAQCESASFDPTLGTIQSQGFTTTSTSVMVEPLPDGTARWVTDASGDGLFAPPAWPGSVPGERQEVRARLRVVSSPLHVSPTGVHESGFSVYRGVCVQGGHVNAGVADDRIFLSIVDPGGVEVCYSEALFDTRAELATYHFEASLTGITFMAHGSNARSGGNTCPTGRFSPLMETWRVGNGSSSGSGGGTGGGGAVASEVVVAGWSIARALPPLQLGYAGTTETQVEGQQAVACDVQGAGEIFAVSSVLAGVAPSSVQWQGWNSVTQSWFDLADGPIEIGGQLVGEASGTRTFNIRLHTSAQHPYDLSAMRVRASNSCGTSVGEPIELARATPVVIQAHPENVSTCVSGEVRFSVDASGEGPRAYQWQWREVGEPGFRDAVVGLNSAGPGLTPRFRAIAIDELNIDIREMTTGLDVEYRCMLTNACGSVTSDPATLTICVADVDDGSGTGTCDGGVDINDLLYFLAQFEAGGLRADVDDGSGTGIPDGGVDINDLLFFLLRFEAGC